MGQSHQREERGPLETQELQGGPRTPKKKKALRDTQEVFTIEWGIPYRMMVGSPRGEAG